MAYLLTMSSQGQITLPKTMREALGLKPRDKVRLTRQGDEFRVEKEKSLAERFAALHAEIPPETWRRIKKDAGKTVHQMMDEYWDSPEGQAELSRMAGEEA